MVFKKIKNIETFIIYFVVLLSINLSGNIFFVSFNHREMVIAVLGIVCFSYLLLRKRNNDRYTINKNSIILFLLAVMFLLITMFINGIDDNYIAVMLQLFIALIVTEIMTHEKFTEVYINIMFFLAFVSLICFFIYQAIPQIALLFPKTDAIASVDYYNAGIFVFQAFADYDYLRPTARNNGIFWEPGAYQAFLTLALAFYMTYKFDSAKIHTKLLYPVVFILTLLSTGSTLALVSIFLVFVANFKRIITFFKDLFKDYWSRFVKSRYRSLIVVLIIVLIVVLCFVLFSVLFSVLRVFILQFVVKLQYEINEGIGNIIARTSLDKIQHIIHDGTFYFFGMSSSTCEIVAPNCWNSIIFSILSYGIPFSMLLLFGYFKYTRRYFEGSFIVVFIMLCFAFSTQMLFLKPLFLCLVFYGIKSQKTQKKYISNDSMGANDD